MTTYDNLNIAETTLIFQMVGGVANSSISSGIFDLSSLAFLPNIPLIDQIEVERVFDTGADTKFNAYSFTIADRRQMFIFPKDWYTINEQTKVLTFKDLSTIPLQTTNSLYYPYSRTYTLINQQTIDIPVVQATSSQINGITRQSDIVYIRRKTPSINSIVTFAPGTRLTTTQLNLQFDQLKYNIQELVAKFRNEAILKYDENAVDGPFLGQGDLKMNNNYIKDVNSPAFTELGTDITDINGLSFPANDFIVTLGIVGDGIISGSLHRTGLNSSPPVFSGDYDAGNLKLINLANGSTAQDAATMGQISNASNLTSGTLNPALFTNATIPLEKLSASRVTYTLPEAALPNANALSATTTYGSSTATNSNNIIYASVDPKGRITSVGHRNLTVDDLPTSGVNSTPTIYGASGKVPQITVDTKGRITVAADRALVAGDISTVNAGAVSGALVAGNLPLVSAGGGGATTVTSIPTSITVDTLGRVTAVASSGLTASNISDFNSTVQTNKLNQMAAPTAPVSLNNQKILLLSDPTIATDAANKNYIDTNYTLTSGLNTPIDARLLTNSVYLSAAGILNAGGKPITNVTDPTNNQDVVTKKYFTDNSIVSTGTAYSVSSKPIIGLTMRAGASLDDNDAVNYGLVRAMSLFNQAVTDPQTFTNAWGSPGTTVTGNKPYVFSLSTLAATTGEMLVVTDSQNRTYVPTTTVPAAAGQFFLLNTSVSPKTVTVYLDSAITPTGTLTVRNFGTSRSVSAAIAGATTLGLVQVPTAGGLLIENGVGNLTLNAATSSQLGGIKIGTGLSIASGTNIVSVTSVAGTSTLGQVMIAAVGTSGLSLDTGTGALSLPTASTTQLGGVKVNTSTGGLTNTSGVIAVSFSDSINSVSTTTAANSKAVNDLRTSSMLLDGTQIMTGKLKTFASTASVASLNVPSGVAVTTRTTGDIWNLSGNLQYSPDGTSTKTLAFLDSSITGNAGTATKLAATKNITLSGAVTSSDIAFDGSSNITIATTLASTAAVTSLSSSHIGVSTSTGAVTLTLPQAIGTTDAVTFGKVTLGNIRISNTANQIDTSTGNLTIDSAGGTTTISDNVSIAGSLAVTGSNATTLGGAVTLSSTLALSNAPCTIALGAAAGTALTSINSAGSATGVNQIGDIILRTPLNGRAFLVGHGTNTTLTAANDAIITEGVLASRIAGLSSTYMSSSGAVLSGAGNQTVGTSNGSFIVQTASTARLTIANTGVATFANQLKVTTGGLQVIAGGLYVGASGTESNVINNGLLVQNGNASCSADVTANIHLTSKLYVDTSFAKLAGSEANPSLTALWDSQAWIRAATAMGFHSYTARANQVCGSGVTTIDATDFKVGVPHYCPLSNPGGGNVNITINLSVPYGYSVVLLYKASSAASFLNAARTVTGIYTDTRASFATMLTKRTAGGGTYSNWTFGTEFKPLSPGAAETYQLAHNPSVSNSHTHDFIFMRIA
jgi:hypothetical protein